jgi:hypothetical protein
MESLQVIYDFLEQCDSSAAHTFLESALEDLTTFKVDGYLRRAGRQPSPAGYIKPPSILFKYWPRLVGYSDQAMNLLWFQSGNLIGKLSQQLRSRVHLFHYRFHRTSLMLLDSTSLIFRHHH